MPFVSLTLSSLALWTMAFLNGGQVSTRIQRGGKTQMPPKESLPGLSGDGVGNLSAVGSVVHQQELEVLFIANKQFSESIRQDVTGLLVRAITNAREGLVASELTTDSRINTVGGSPRGL